jgi:hypothetical protein
MYCSTLNVCELPNPQLGTTPFDEINSAEFSKFGVVIKILSICAYYEEEVVRKIETRSRG